MMNNTKKYSIDLIKCSHNCPGKISPWRPALGENYNCPLGVAFCGIWDADNIIIKPMQINIDKTSKENVA